MSVARSAQHMNMGCTRYYVDCCRGRQGEGITRVRCDIETTPRVNRGGGCVYTFVVLLCLQIVFDLVHHRCLTFLVVRSPFAIYIDKKLGLIIKNIDDDDDLGLVNERFSKRSEKENKNRRYCSRSRRQLIIFFFYNNYYAITASDDFTSSFTVYVFVRIT